MINLRSPYFVIVNETNLTACDIDIYVYTGTQTTDQPASAQYSLSSTAINEYVTFDIAELARDYIDDTFDGSYPSNVVWVDYQLTHYISDVAQTPEAVVELTGFDGYQYFEDGAQSSSETYTAPDLLQSNLVVYKSPDAIVRVPVLQDNVTEVFFLNKGIQVNEETITSTSESTDVIRYVDNEGASQDNFKARVEADSGTYEEEAERGVFGRYPTFPCDTIIIKTSAPDTKIRVEDIPECKYDPIKATFINKFGAFQDIWFFKRSILSISTEESKYNAHLISNGAYNTYEHQKRIINKNGIEQLELNSGYYPEEYNEVFKQMLLSERVWIEYNDMTLPVNIVDSGLTFKDSVGDKLIDYTILVEFAFDKIGNIR